MAFKRLPLFSDSQLMAAPENLPPSLVLHGPLMLAIKRSNHVCVCLNTELKEDFWGFGGVLGEQ